MYKNGTLLIEIGTEELPIDNLKKLGKDFVYYLSLELKKKFFLYSDISFYITLRRISCLVYNISYNQIINEKYNIIYGPKISIYDNEYIGNINKKVYFWIKNIGINHNMISYIKCKKKKIFFYKKKIIIRNINFFINNILKNTLFFLKKKRKLMRWGKNNYSFIRPVNNLVVMYDSIILDVNIFGIKSKNILFGHRFIGKKNILLNNANNYINFLLNYGKVIVDYYFRKSIIINSLKNISLKNNFCFFYKKKFLNKIVSMLEWPVLILSKFNKKFLFLPKELLDFVIKETNCFSIYDKKGNLLNYFVIVLNIEINSLNYIFLKNDYIKIINSKLKNISFFFNKDRKFSLISYLPKLKNIIFHDKLGTYFDKIKRMLFLSKKMFIYLNYLNIKNSILSYSILLIKCDLATSLYKEYNDLKGIIGMYYSLLDKEFYKISFIIRDHYYPNFCNDIISVDIYSNIISLIDKLDTLIGISLLNNSFYIKKNNDPYALRRLSLLIVKIILNSKFYFNLYKVIKYNIYLYKKNFNKEKIIYIIKFIFKRSINIFLELGYRKKIINSFINLNIFDFLDIKSRMDSVKYFYRNEKFIMLVNVNKRINNIILKFNFLKLFKINSFYFLNSIEIKLYKYILWLEKKSLNCFLNKNYNKLLLYFFMSISRVENFFCKIKINVNNDNIKNNRLSLLKKLSLLFLKFIDFSYYY